MIFQKIRKYKHIILLALFVSIILIVKVVSLSDEAANACIALCGLFCYKYYMSKGKASLKKKSIQYGFLMSVCLLLSYLYNGNSNISNILWIWSYMGVALLFYERGFSLKVAFVLSITYAFFFLYDTLILGNPVETLLNNASANNIPTLCMFPMVLYYIQKFREDIHANIDYIPILLVILVSIVTATRGALLALFFFLFFAVLHNIRIPGHKKKSVLILLVGIVAVAYLYSNYYAEVGDKLDSKAENYGTESARTDIWKDYFRGVTDSPLSFAFGVPGLDPRYPDLSFYSGNPHNSFLMLHSKFGIIGFSFFTFMLIGAFLLTIRRKEYGLSGVFFLLFLRSSFDWVAFPGVFDIFYWYYLFYFVDKRILRKKNKNSTIVYNS